MEEKGGSGHLSRLKELPGVILAPTEVKRNVRRGCLDVKSITQVSKRS